MLRGDPVEETVSSNTFCASRWGPSMGSEEPQNLQFGGELNKDINIIEIVFTYDKYSIGA